MLANFSQEKKYLLSELKNLKEFFNEIVDTLGKEAVDEITKKIDKVMKDVENEKFKVVLFGSFSDGKSTIISSIIKNLNIKISPEPTTDKIQEYKHKDFLLVDTPGLFSNQKLHDELTKKYISEADLIIFTTEATNPLKESQHEVIKWILKDLGKISQTVFVINKMDAVADIEDKEDFNRSCKTKKEVVKSTIEKLIGKKIDDNLIVCLSADPWGMGLNYWLQRMDEYRRLSNIQALESIVETVINKKKNTLRSLTIQALKRDFHQRGLVNVEEKTEILEKNVKHAKIEYEDLESQISSLRKEAQKAILRIKENLIALKKEIIQEIMACPDKDSLASCCYTHIGKDGKTLEQQIEVIIKKELEPIEDYLKTVYKDIERIDVSLNNIKISIKQFSTNVDIAVSFFGGVGKIISQIPTSTLRNTIIATRDFLKIPIKFKPWGAVKLAKKIGVAGAIVGILADIKDVWDKAKFQKKKEEIVKDVEEFFNELISSVPHTIEEFFKPIDELENGLRKYYDWLQGLDKDLQKYNQTQRILAEKIKELEQ